jgi:hypothetical protein
MSIRELGMIDNGTHALTPQSRPRSAFSTV